MKSRVLLLCTILFTIAFLIEPLESRAATPKKPNVLLILCDDLGFETMPMYGGTSYKTPNLDALAKSGLLFKNAIATPLCSPSRVQLMTGRYGFRTGWVNLIGRGDDAKEYFDPKKEKTFGHILKEAGYATALAGKWQLAEFQKHPDHVKECGFDEYSCWTWLMDGKRTDRYWDPSIWQNGKLIDAKGKYGDDIFSDFLIDFMTRHKDQPFFAYYPMCLVHEPHLPTPDSADAADHGKGKRNRKNQKENSIENPTFADMIAYTDKTIGKLVAALDKLGLREDTLIIFTGDNGTDRRITSMWKGQSVQGQKGKTSEFGTHVPFIANWKGTTPVGKVSTDLIDFSDVVPTLVELSGAKLPKGVTIDGQSFLPQLRNQTGKPREWVFSQLGKERIARDQRYMLHENGTMFDVVDDPFEKNDLSGKTRPEIVEAQKRLQAVLDRLK